jgi:hypothetical protein
MTFFNQAVVLTAPNLRMIFGIKIHFNEEKSCWESLQKRLQLVPEDFWISPAGSSHLLIKDFSPDVVSVEKENFLPHSFIRKLVMGHSVQST